MARLLVGITAVFLLTNPLLAQSAQPVPGGAECEQIRVAVATYGYAAARRYALVHYGKEAARYGDRCLTREQRVKDTPVESSHLK
jgi:hypothetical protein